MNRARQTPISPRSPENSYQLKKTLFEWEKDDRGNFIRINVAESSSGSLYLDIRNWYTHKDTQEILPGKGIAIPIVDDNIDQLMDGMDIVSDQWESGELIK